MPLTRPTFCGASVARINSSLGYGSEGSTLDVTVVEDPTNGDSFNLTAASVGAPGVFTIGAYTFRGIIRKYTQDKSINGYPTYNVQLIDPRHLLDATKIILADYRLSVTGIYNLINVFGYYENISYGSSQSNDTGMPWQLVRDGITTIVNNPAGSWGGPITYRGVSYSIDLSNLPSLPTYFRVGGRGHGLSILEFIQICCDAANYDYFIKLVGTTITVSCVIRGNAYPLGTISNILNTVFTGSVIRSSAGIEERAETNSVFLIGGDVHELTKVTPANAYPFWGFNAAGNIIYGGADKHAVFYAKNPATQTDGYSIYSYPVKMYGLYTPEIAAIIGSTTWFTNDLELQVLLGLGGGRDSYGSWVTYLRKADPTLYTTINLSSQSPSIQPSFRAPELPNNFTNTNPNQIRAIRAANRGAIAETGEMRLRLVYECLFKYAKEYYGKKFALNIPGIYRYTDTETGVINYSAVPADAGFYSESVSNDLLSLPTYASDLFQTQDGRYVPFVVYNASNADLSRVNPANSLIDGSNLYVKAKLNNQVFFDGSDPFVVIEVDPVYDYPDAVVGMSGIVGALIKSTGINLEDAPATVVTIGDTTLANLRNKGQFQGSIPIITHPAARLPSGYEIPLKSNLLTYGPWYAQGATGRVHYEQDSTLVPWNYGGYSGLNVAGNAKALHGISQAQVIETGYIEVVGPPAYNLGDVIVASGTNITNISVGWGDRGVTTTYRFETYVPKFGQLAKYNIDRLQRLSINNIKRSAEIKALNRSSNLAVLAEAEATNTLNLMAALPENINIRTPQNALVGTVVAASGNVFVHPVVSSTTYKEALGLIPASGDDYNNTAISTWENIIGPYQNKSLVSVGGSLMPTIYQPTASGIWDDEGVLNSNTLNVWKASPSGWTTRCYTRGEAGYEEMNDNFLIGEDQSNKIKRSFALKAPLVLCGWGYGMTGNVAPASSDYLRNYSTHKVGPVDLLWDDNRGVWTVHDILNVKTTSSFGPSGIGTALVYVKGSGAFNIAAYNYTNETIPADVNRQIGYVASDNRWYILNGGGGSSSGGSGIMSVNSQIGPDISHLVTQDANFILALGEDSNTIGIYPSGNNIYHYLPNAHPEVAAGLITNQNQNITGTKSFTKGYIKFPNSGITSEDSFLLVGRNTIDYDVAGPYPEAAQTLEVDAAAGIGGYYCAFDKEVLSFDSYRNSAKFYIYGQYYDVYASGLSESRPTYNIKYIMTPSGGPATIEYNGIYATLGWGATVAGGIVYGSGSPTVPLTALPSGSALASLFPSGMDEKVKISSNDTTTGYLVNKVSAGSGIFVQKINSGANEQLEINTNLSTIQVLETNILPSGIITTRVGSGNNIRTYANVMYSGGAYILNDYKNINRVDSIATGKVNCVFDTPMTSDKYVITTGVATDSGDSPLIVTHGKKSNNTKKTTDFNLNFYNLSGTLTDPDEFSFIIVSDVGGQGNGGSNTGSTNTEFEYFSPGTYYLMPPSWATYLNGQCVGGGASSDIGGGGNGGAGGSYGEIVNRSASGLITIRVGVPGVIGNGGSGGDSEIEVNSIVIARGKGGNSGTSNVGDVTYTGGTGGTPDAINGGGGGGGGAADSAGNGGNGGNGNNGIGGAGGISSMLANGSIGIGGSGGTVGGSLPTSGSYPGGGGGAYDLYSYQASNGAGGYVRIWFT